MSYQIKPAGEPSKQNTTISEAMEQPGWNDQTVSYHSSKFEDVEPSEVEDGGSSWHSSFALKAFRIVFTILLLGLAGVSLWSWSLNQAQLANPLHTPEELGHIETAEQTEKLDEKTAQEYLFAQANTLNILVMGVDDDGYDNGRSDAMILLSLRQDSSQIKMLSFMRDTVSYIPSRETYEKLNHNYVYGGPLETVRALNMNYDLNISDYVVFNDEALIAMIDKLGGVEVSFDAGELYDFNELAYQGYYPPVDDEGLQSINGTQAKYYMQIRQNSGGDDARTQRQREVIYNLFNKSKSLGKAKILALATEMMPKIKTSFNLKSMTNLIDYYDEIQSAATIVEGTFPFDKLGLQNNEIWYEVPDTVESNITKLHQFIYDINDYQPSDRATEYAETIRAIFGLYDQEIYN